MKRVSDECRRWDERYRLAPGPYFGDAPTPFLASSVAPELPGAARAALCIGEGEGRDAVFLAKQGYRVTAVDGSGVAVDRIHVRARDAGVTIDAVHMDLADWEPPARTYDLVASLYCHLPPDLRAGTHRAAARALRPGGLLVIEGFSTRQLSEGMQSGGPRDAALLFTADALRADVRGLIDIEELFEGPSDIAYGKHTGPAFVTRLRGRAAPDREVMT
jgi:SAM-dependent methyltransferase